MEATLTTPTETQLTKIVTESGLQITDADAIKQSYLPYFTQLAEIKEQATKINFENPTPLDEKIARELRLKTVKIRTGSMQVKDERKRIHSLKANVEQSAWNLIKSTCELDEEVFLQVEKKREIAEAKRINELKSEREKELQPYIEFVSIEFINLGAMNDEQYSKLLEGGKLQLQAKQEAAAKAELERIAKEKADAEERERIRIENEKLKAEVLAKEKELSEQKAKADDELKAVEEMAKKERELAEKKLVEEKSKADAEAKRLKDIADASLKEEQEKAAKLQAELKAKADAEAAKIKAEEEAKEALLTASDKDKLIELGKSLAAIELPVAKSKKVKDTIAQFEVKRNELLSYLRTEIKTIK